MAELFWRRLGPWGLFLAIPIVLAVFVIESAIRSAIDSKVEPLFRETEPFLSPSWFRVGAVAALGILIVWGVIRVNRRYRGFGKTWWERDELEIYYLANLSVRRRADATPLDREPVLTRVRLLKDAIRNGPSSAEWAVASVFRRWIQKFKSLEDEFFRQRYVDLIDLERRLLRKLLPKQGVASSPDHPVVLVTQDPTPSEVVSVDRKQVMGFVTEMGGRPAIPRSWPSPWGSPQCSAWARS